MRLLLAAILFFTAQICAETLSAQAASRDTTLLKIGSYFGGESEDRIVGMVRDAEGNIFVAGTTESGKFPITSNAVFGSHLGGRDIFLAKFSRDGQTLLFSTYYGGSGRDEANALSLDLLGNPIIAGTTFSNDFPATAAFSNGPVSEIYSGGAAFAAQFTSDGSRVLFSVALGGAKSDEARDIAVSPDGTIWIAGVTESPDFPIASFAQQSRYGGQEDGFIAEIHPLGTLLLYSSFWGGMAKDEISTLTFDASGTLFCVGTTASPDFPGAKSDDRISSEVFVSKLRGGAIAEFTRTFAVIGAVSVNDICFSPSNGGNIFITGSAEWSSLVGIKRGGFRELTFGGSDAFIISMNLDGIVNAATFFGGAKDDFSTSIAVEKDEVSIVGSTYSSILPTTNDALSKQNRGGRDCFFAIFDAALQNVQYCTFLGGSSDDNASAAATFNGTLYVAGSTSSRDFSVVSGGFETTYAGGVSDGFVQVFKPTPLLSILPNPLNFGGIDLGFSITIDTLQVKNISQFRNAHIDTIRLLDDAFGAFTLDVSTFFPTLPAGIAANPRLAFTPKNEGEAKGSLIVWANDIRYEVALHGIGVAPPPQFLLRNIAFDTIDANAQAYDSLNITNVGNRAFAVDSIRPVGTSEGRFAILEKTPFNIPASSTYFAKALFFPAKEGFFSQEFRVYARNVSMPVQLQGYAKSGLPPPIDSIILSNIDFGDVALHSTVEKKVFIVNAVARAVIIDSIAIENDEDDAFAVIPPKKPWVIPSGDSIALIINALPKTSGNRKANIAAYIGKRRFASDATVNGVLPPSPKLTVQDVNFKATTVLQFQLDSTMVTNRGNAAADILSASLVGADSDDFFIESFTPRVVSAGDSMTIMLRFAPKTAGNKTAELHLSAASGNVSASLRGTALRPPDTALLSAAPIVFPAVYIDSMRDSTIVLYSIGSAAARVDSMQIVGNNVFSLAFLPTYPVILNAGENLKVGVRFTPKKKELYFAKLKAWYGGKVVECNISGEGILLPEVPFVPRVKVALPKLSVKIGQNVAFPLTLTGSRRSIDSLIGKQYAAHVRFNASVLDPMSNRGQIDDAFHTILLSGTAANDTLCVFYGIAALGNADSTVLRIVDCIFTDDNSRCKVETTLSDGLLRISDIWQYGGPRLVSSMTPEPVIVIRPNPVNYSAIIQLYRVQKGCIVQIVDGIGREITRYQPKVNEDTGEGTVLFSAQAVRGVYFCRVISGARSAVKALYVE